MINFTLHTLVEVLYWYFQKNKYNIIPRELIIKLPSSISIILVTLDSQYQLGNATSSCWLFDFRYGHAYYADTIEVNLLLLDMLPQNTHAPVFILTNANARTSLPFPLERKNGKGYRHYIRLIKLGRTHYILQNELYSISFWWHADVVPCLLDSDNDRTTGFSQ